MKTFRVTALLLTLALAVSVPGLALEGKAKKRKGPAGSQDGVSASVSFSFGKTEIQLIRDWFTNPRNVSGQPPGHAKREELPPGLQRQLVRNGTLPPGLEGRIQPLPVKLRKRLPQPPDGVEIVVGSRVLAVHVQTSKILDLVADLVVSF
jgi:hypothetical protein